jgi:hypothetical protein
MRALYARYFLIPFKPNISTFARVANFERFIQPDGGILFRAQAIENAVVSIKADGILSIITSCPWSNTLALLGILYLTLAQAHSSNYNCW